MSQNSRLVLLCRDCIQRCRSNTLLRQESNQRGERNQSPGRLSRTHCACSTVLQPTMVERNDCQTYRFTIFFSIQQTAASRKQHYKYLIDLVFMKCNFYQQRSNNTFPLPQTSILSPTSLLPNPLSPHNHSRHPPGGPDTAYSSNPAQARRPTPDPHILSLQIC